MDNPNGSGMGNSEDSAIEMPEDFELEEEDSESNSTCTNIVILDKEFKISYEGGDRDDKSVITTEEVYPTTTTQCCCVAHHPELKEDFSPEELCKHCLRTVRCNDINRQHQRAINEGYAASADESEHPTRCCCERCFPEITQETVLHANRHCDDYDCCCLQHSPMKTKQYAYPTAQQSCSANTDHDMSKQVSAGQPGMYQSSGAMPSCSKFHHQPTMTGPAPSPQQSTIVNPSQQLNSPLAMPYFRRENICEKCCRNRSCRKENRRGAADRTGSEISQYAYPTTLQSVSGNPTHDMSKQVSAGKPGMYQSSGAMPCSKHHHLPTMTGPAPSPQPSSVVNPSQQLNRHVPIPKPENRRITRQRAKEIESMQKIVKSAHDKVCGWLGLKNCAPGELKFTDEESSESSESKNQDDKDKDKDT